VAHPVDSVGLARAAVPRIVVKLMNVFDQRYNSIHADVILIDPIESVMRLQNRRQQYEYVSQSDIISNCKYFFDENWV